jgi:diaminopimelate decarboxylase
MVAAPRGRIAAAPAMDHFAYRDGSLYCEDVPARAIAAAAGTPCYVYSLATLRGHYDRLVAAFAALDPLVCFSIKSCSNLSIIRALGERGAGMDLVSGGELYRCLRAGVDPARCVYAGVGKTDQEIRQALEARVGWFNIESEQEFENVAAIAASLGVAARAALRVNPDVDPRTHRYTTTGKRRTKFGVDIDRAAAFFEQYGGHPSCRLEGLHLHIGSPIYTTEPYVASIHKTLALMEELERRGFAIRMLDLGGGFGADYETSQTPPLADYAAEIVPLLREHVGRGVRLVLEPGRTITANAGILLLRVLYRKHSGDKAFVICDGGMNVLIRPSHYDAFHFIWPCEVDAARVPPRRARQLELRGLERVDVVGPICESGDFLALDRDLPPLRRGDLLAVFSSGAYAMTMASRYNSMGLPAEILVDGARLRLVRRRERYADLTAHETEPVDLAWGSPAAASVGDEALEIAE